MSAAYSPQGIGAINDSVRQQIDAYIRNEMASEKIPGIALIILQNNSLVYGQGYGYSNIEHKIPVKLETMFQSGSMGKQFTAMAVMILVERGELDLDTSIREYIDDAPKAWKRITVRHLLTHTAGMGDYPDDFDYHADTDEDGMFELIKMIPLDYEPGDQYVYSNLGYITLGVLVRRVTDEFYGDFLQQNVFKPLGMQTARVITESDIIPNRASGYVLEDDQIKNQEWVSPTVNTFADGALYLSMHDMIKWDRGLSSNIILKKRSSFDQMWSPATLNDGTTNPYGFGWEIDETISGMRVVKHSGAWQGFETMIIRVLDARVTVVVFTNLDAADSDEIATKVLEIYNPQLALKPSEGEDEDDEEEEEE